MTDHDIGGDADEFVARIAPPLRATERLDDSFEARVMSAVDATRRAQVRTPVQGWWIRPRTLQLSPLGGLAMAAGLAGLVALGALAGNGRSTSIVVATPSAGVAPVPDTVHLVRFVFVDRAATSVRLVGDFNGWAKDDAALLERGVNGSWSASVPLPPGRHEYVFVVDGHDGESWVADPFAPTVRDEFRTESSVITVAAPRHDDTSARAS